MPYSSRRMMPSPADSITTIDSAITEVFDPEFKFIYEVPSGCVVHLPPPRLNITRLVLCRNYKAFDQMSCTMGHNCKFVHSDCDYNTLQAHPIHVNYIWRREELCTYARLPAGDMLEVLQPNGDGPVELIPTGCILLTDGAVAARDNCLPRHCPHFNCSRMCKSGERCPFVHVIYIDPSVVGQYKRAPARPMSVDGSPGLGSSKTSGKMNSHMRSSPSMPMFVLPSPELRAANSSCTSRPDCSPLRINESQSSRMFMSCVSQRSGNNMNNSAMHKNNNNNNNMQHSMQHMSPPSIITHEVPQLRPYPKQHHQQHHYDAAAESSSTSANNLHGININTNNNGNASGSSFHYGGPEKYGMSLSQSSSRYVSVDSAVAAAPPAPRSAMGYAAAAMSQQQQHQQTHQQQQQQCQAGQMMDAVSVNTSPILGASMASVSGSFDCTGTPKQVLRYRHDPYRAETRVVIQ